MADILTGQTLFYVGIAIMAVSILIGIVVGFLMKLKSLRLNQKFDVEYGEVRKKKGKSYYDCPRRYRSF